MGQVRKRDMEAEETGGKETKRTRQARNRARKVGGKRLPLLFLDIFELPVRVIYPPPPGPRIVWHDDEKDEEYQANDSRPDGVAPVEACHSLLLGTVPLLFTEEGLAQSSPIFKGR